MPRDNRDRAFKSAVGAGLVLNNTTRMSLAKRIRSSRTSINNWLDNPSSITLGKFRILAEELKMSDEDVIKIIKRRSI